MNKKLFALIFVATTILSVVSAGGRSDKTGTVDVGIVLPTKDEPRWIQDETRFEALLDKTDFSYQILFSQGSPAIEKTNVETLVSKGMKVLIICPQDCAAVASTCDSANRAGVKVIGYDRLITGTTSVDYNVGFNSESVGTAQGEFLIKQAKGKNNPLYLYAGAVSDENAFVFFNGAWKVLQPKITDGTFVIKNSSKAVALQSKNELTREELSEIVGQITTDWDFSVAKNKAQANLSSVTAADKGDVFILAPNDGTARSIADVFASDTGVHNYVITGQDAEKASIQYIIDGKQSMTVLKDTRKLTSAAAKMATSILQGETPEINSTYNNGAKDVPMYQIPVTSVSKNTVIADIFDSGYYNKDEFTGL